MGVGVVSLLREQYSLTVRVPPAPASSASLRSLHCLSLSLSPSQSAPFCYSLLTAAAIRKQVASRVPVGVTMLDPLQIIEAARWTAAQSNPDVITPIFTVHI